MNDQQARQLGEMLRDRRRALGLSTHQLAKQAHTRQSTIIRLEHGRFASPRPDKLFRIATVLGLAVADIYAHVGYLAPGELPAFESYLAARYAELPEAAIAELAARFHELASQHGITNSHTAGEGAPA